MKLVTLAIAALLSSVWSAQAHAQDAGLHHAQAGALLTYAEAETQVLYNGLLAKEFDPDLAKHAVKEIERALGDAKRSLERARILHGDDKVEADFTKVLEVLRRGETQLAKFAKDLEEQAGEEEEEASDHRDDTPKEEEVKKVDWNLLKTGAGWLFVDVKDAKAGHVALGKKLKFGVLKAPSKPSGARS